MNGCSYKKKIKRNEVKGDSASSKAFLKIKKDSGLCCNE